MTNGSEKIKENLGINMKKYKKSAKTHTARTWHTNRCNGILHTFFRKRYQKAKCDVLGKLADALKIEPYELLK